MFTSQAKKDAIAQRMEELNQFIAQLSELPQFIETGKGLLHGINGCIVRIKGESIDLCWVESYGGSDGSHAALYSHEQMEKYLALMKAQAANLSQSVGNLV